MVTSRYVELVTERPVERFLNRMFRRETPLRSLQIVTPFISPMSDTPYPLSNLRKRVEDQRIPLHLITRDPSEDYQREAMAELLGSPWIEVRYNPSIHAKVYLATAYREAESFALFGSSNLTSKSIYSNIEAGMLVYGIGPGREILQELHYWVSVRLRTLKESRLIQPIRGKRR